MPEQSIITVKNLVHQYKGTSFLALKDVTLDIPRGICLGLLGPNGAGKTTLISLMAGLQNVQQGSITLNGCLIQKLSRKEAHKISVIPQDFAFYPRLSVWENMCFFAALYKKKKATYLDEILNSVGLITYKKTAARNLSGGLKRRLNFAIGLLNDPALIFMDEPTVGVDPESRQFILDNVSKLVSQGTTVIYTSHYLYEIEQICQKVVILDQGVIRYEGAIQDVLHHHGEARILMVTDQPIASEDLAHFNAQPTADHKGLIMASSENAITSLLTYFQHKGYTIVSLNYGYGTLEAFYLNLLRERREEL